MATQRLPLVILMVATAAQSSASLASAVSMRGAGTRPRPAGARYRIEAARSRFIVRAETGGLFGAFGHDHTIAIRSFSGHAEFDTPSPQNASLNITIDANSLAVVDKVSEKDRREIESTMRDQVLETAKYPEIVFRSTKIDVARAGDQEYSAKIWGDLTLHGVKQSGLINAKVSVGVDTVRAQGRFPLRQTDYKIRPVSLLGGTVKVKDELKLSFDIIAVKE